ncbi:Uncharacterised protein [Mycobacteroides abscessus subsp. abscessus]|nr:Uncharacterised protein [Mycobacteroides abscessus subsp. abscessus]
MCPGQRGRRRRGMLPRLRGAEERGDHRGVAEYHPRHECDHSKCDCGPSTSRRQRSRRKHPARRGEGQHGEPVGRDLAPHLVDHARTGEPPGNCEHGQRDISDHSESKENRRNEIGQSGVGATTERRGIVHCRRHDAGRHDESELAKARVRYASSETGGRIGRYRTRNVHTDRPFHVETQGPTHCECLYPIETRGALGDNVRPRVDASAEPLRLCGDETTHPHLFIRMVNSWPDLLQFRAMQPQPCSISANSLPVGTKLPTGESFSVTAADPATSSTAIGGTTTRSCGRPTVSTAPDRVHGRFTSKTASSPGRLRKPTIRRSVRIVRNTSPAAVHVAQHSPGTHTRRRGFATHTRAEFWSRCTEPPRKRPAIPCWHGPTSSEIRCAASRISRLAVRAASSA